MSCANHWTLRLAVGLMLVATWPVYAQTTADPMATQGYTGLITTPTAYTLDEGLLDLGFNNDIESPTRNKALDRAANFTVGLGILPHVEMVGRLAGGYDRRDKYIRGDLSANLKISAYESEHFAVAGGVTDLGGSAQNFGAHYLVATARYQPFTASLGFGTGPQRLDGVFGGVAWSAFPWMDLLADYDADTAHLGIRVTWPTQGSFQMSGMLKALSSEDAQNASGSANVRLPLDFRSLGMGDVEIPSEEPIRVHETLSEKKQVVAVDAENVAFRQRQSDSFDAACAAAGANAEGVNYIQRRYGLAVLNSYLSCDQQKASYVGYSRWWSWFADTETGQLTRKTDAFPWGTELRLALAMHHFIGNERGLFHYSLAARPSFRVQLPYAMGGYATYNLPIANSLQFEDGRPFDFYRYNSALAELAAQWGYQPLPGFIGVVTAGRMRYDEVDYNAIHNETALNLYGGIHQLRMVHAEYDAEEKFSFPDRSLQLYSYRFWWLWASSTLEVTYGDFFYGERGTRFTAKRYFGDTIVEAYWRREDRHHNFLGFGLSIPLTPRRSLTAGPLLVTGQPRFSDSIGTVVNDPSGRNLVRTDFMVEPKPEYNLITDYLDSDRMHPAFIDSGGYR